MLFTAALAPQPAWAVRERAGQVDAFIVLDESGSMAPVFGRVTTYLADALVKDYLEPGDYLCVVGFSSDTRVRISQRVSSAAEKENLARMVRDLNVVPQGFTDMGRALEETLGQVERLADPSHQQIVLILTDGVNHPPRDSPYFLPVRPDKGGKLPPPSGFGEAFLAQSTRLAAAGWRLHVVGIGLDTDAGTLARALGSGHTIVRQFDPAELRSGLARLWDDSINLVRLELPVTRYLPGGTVSGRVHLQSVSDHEREIHVRGMSVAKLQRAVGPALGQVPAVSAKPALERWSIPARQSASFDLVLSVPQDIPPGDYTAVLSFDQASAVRFFPTESSFSFHVPSFWELHGATVVSTGAGVVVLALGGVFYWRRPIKVGVAFEGESAPAAKPVRFRIGTSVTLGGGATDRLRVAGLPQKVAALERRAVDRFALVSTRPELVPTLLEYRLGEPVEVRLGEAGERRTVRFVRSSGKVRPPRPRTPVPSRLPPPSTGGGVDFR